MGVSTNFPGCSLDSNDVMRITTWNVNGIRTLKPLQQKLDALDSDIICIQETRLSVTSQTFDLDESTALVPGYHSFFSLCRTRTGYSGVATYCRKRTATPLAATNDLQDSSITPFIPNNQQCNVNECPCGGISHTEETLRSIHDEGRCIITDHGLFILFNVYIPALSTDYEGRIVFKLQFLHVLHSKMDALRRTGRMVILAGDMNICPARIDSAERMQRGRFAVTASIDTAEWERSPSRVWLDKLLSTDEVEGKDRVRFVDAFREMYPTKTGAYTCWSEATRGRELNFGVRIDLIIMDERLFEKAVIDLDVWQHVMGSDHCPVSMNLLNDEAMMKKDIMPREPPPFCTQFLPKFAKRQQSIKQFFMKHRDRDRDQSSTSLPLILSSSSSLPGGGMMLRSPSLLDIPPVPSSPLESPVKKRSEDKKQESIRHKITKTKKRCRAHQMTLTEPRKKLPTKQLTFKSFGINRSSPDVQLESLSQSISKRKVNNIHDPNHQHQKIDNEVSQQSVASSNDDDNDDDDNLINGLSAPTYQSQSRLPGTINADGEERRKQSAKAWRELLSGPPPPPLCRHGKPCVLKTVTKGGENKSKTFFSCAYPRGEGSQANCNFFKWAPFHAKYPTSTK